MRDADPAFLQFYLGLEKRLPQELTRYHAETVKGLKPQVSIWKTGSQNNAFSLFCDPIHGFQKHKGLKLTDKIKPENN
jgi:hypothetical protein